MVAIKVMFFMVKVKADKDSDSYIYPLIETELVTGIRNMILAKGLTKDRLYEEARRVSVRHVRKRIWTN